MTVKCSVVSYNVTSLDRVPCEFVYTVKCEYVILPINMNDTFLQFSDSVIIHHLHSTI